jgi:hypothetical protein
VAEYLKKDDTFYAQNAQVVAKLQKKRTRLAGHRAQSAFAVITIVISFMTVVSDFLYFIHAYYNDILPISQKDTLAGLVQADNHFNTEADVLGMQKKLIFICKLCLLMAGLQMILTFMASAYHALHLNAEDTDRNHVKMLIRLMFIEGICLEFFMVYLTNILQRDLEVHLMQQTTTWMFITNVITSGFEILATLADITSMWCDYEAQRSLIEKELTFKHVFVPNCDEEWVYGDIDPWNDIKSYKTKDKDGNAKWHVDEDSFHDLAIKVEASQLREAIRKVWKRYIASYQDAQRKQGVDLPEV